MSRFGYGKVMRMVVALAALLACLAVPEWSFASEQTGGASARVRVFQEYKVPASGMQNAFEYRIVAQESGASLPVGEDGVPFDTFVLTRDEDSWLTFPIVAANVNEAGRATYHYVLEPVTPELPDGLYYVDLLSPNLVRGVNRYYLDINVAPPAPGTTEPVVVPTVHREGWDGPKVTDPGWRVAYEKPVEGDTPNGSGTPSGDNAQSGSGTPTGDKTTAQPSQATPTTDGTSGTSSSTSSATSSTTRQSTAQTRDSSREAPALIGAGLALLTAGLLYRLRRAGDGHA